MIHMRRFQGKPPASPKNSSTVVPEKVQSRLRPGFLDTLQAHLWELRTVS